jgi:hypothetical protein
MNLSSTRNLIFFVFFKNTLNSQEVITRIHEILCISQVFAIYYVYNSTMGIFMRYKVDKDRKNSLGVNKK